MKFILSLLGLEELVLQRLEDKEDKPEEPLEEYDVFRYNLKPIQSSDWEGINMTASPPPPYSFYLQEIEKYLNEEAQIFWFSY